MRKIFKNKQITTFQIISLGFMSVILLGALLLTLPGATQGPGRAPFLDALFTSTSAVCVTGLIIYDTATYWSTFGQFVIMVLIQIGGMGVVTLAIAITIASGRKIGLMQRSTMKEAIAAPKVGGIVKMTGFIIKGVFLIEGIGAALLFTVFGKEFGLAKGLWYSIFHSVSAFCNAGFDLQGIKTPFSSLMSYSANPIINITIMSLIVIGGIGFFTWDDIKRHKLHFKAYRMQSKVALSVTAFLITIPAIYFYFFEFQYLEGAERFWSSLFQSVTPRTAGFNTADLTLISESGIMLTIMLMVIGGSPGSTAGGMKTTTLAVLLSGAVSVFRKRDDVHFFRRRVPDQTVRDAATIFLMYVTLFMFSGMIISRVDNVPLVTALFETASAIGTVGLSLGITPGLSTVSHLILIGLMFFGRVGGLTLIFATVSGRNSNVFRYPQERITVG